MKAEKSPISPVTRSKQTARASYDRMSRWYDILSASSERPITEECVELLGIHTGETVLEIGCGTGYGLTLAGRSAGRSGCILGVDLSGRMCQKTRSRISSTCPDVKSLVICGDGAGLPLVAASLDVVFMSFTLELFAAPEIPQVLLECRRVLKPGGRLCLVAMSKKPGKPSWMVRFYEKLHAAFPEYIDCRPIYLEEEVRQAGFKINEIHTHLIWGLPVCIAEARKEPTGANS
jgi:ubiquinone/menaquinone biosynthesis C-methylase UbiE